MKRSLIRRKARKAPTAAERRHMDRVAAMDCLALNNGAGYPCRGRLTLHHVTSNGNHRIARIHRRIVPLCERHHQIQAGPVESVEAVGHAAFTAMYGIDLLAEADRLWSESNA